MGSESEVEVALEAIIAIDWQALNWNYSYSFAEGILNLSGVWEPFIFVAITTTASFTVNRSSSISLLGSCLQLQIIEPFVNLFFACCWHYRRKMKVGQRYSAS